MQVFFLRNEAHGSNARYETQDGLPEPSSQLNGGTWGQLFHGVINRKLWLEPLQVEL